MAGLLLGAVLSAPAQNHHSDDADTLQIPEKLFKDVEQRSDRMNERMLRSDLRYLRSLQAIEEKMKNKLAAKDAMLAAALFDDALADYGSLRGRLAAAGQTTGQPGISYIAGLDTLKSALAFLKAGGLHAGSSSLQHAINGVQVLQNRFSQADEVQKYIEERNMFLQQQLGRFGLVKELQNYGKQAYYYREQLRQYKNVLNDPSKLKAGAMELLKKSPPFRQFFQTHSQLASMFRMPGSETVLPAVSSSLQNRDAVAQSLSQRFGGPVQLQQLLQQTDGGLMGMDNLNKVINAVNKVGTGPETVMPAFTPNNQRTKRIRERLELGNSLQTVRANRFFPSTTDIALSVGYKLNDRSIAGLGGSYRMGWGRDIQHVSITHQGVGLRTFLDYKIKGCWVTGGAEMNYRSRFNSFEILNNYSAWQKSALLGLSKKYSLSKKFNGNMQLLYDFLWKQQVPRTQALLFRFGYTLK